MKPSLSYLRESLGDKIRLFKEVNSLKQNDERTHRVYAAAKADMDHAMDEYIAAFQDIHGKEENWGNK